MSVDNKKPTAKRSSKWAAVRKAHLIKFPTCAVCGGNKKLEVHHQKPYHKFPELELVESNLITLCENNKSGVNCHLAFGHLGNYKSYNKSVRTDAKTWNSKFKNRPE